MSGLWIFTDAAATAQRLHCGQVNKNTDRFSRSPVGIDSDALLRKLGQ
jgi:hypothetical protein